MENQSKKKMKKNLNKNKLYNIIKDGERLLKKANNPDAEIDARIFAQELMDYTSLDIILNRDTILTDKEVNKYKEWINLRKSGVPLQYILGSQEFMGLKFKVKPGVLIPRQDTETLVETIIDYSKSNKIENIIELGVGSGCISISLAVFLKKVSIIGIDISKKALKIARENARINAIEDKVDFIYGDLLKAYKGPKNVDLIISNPPYIETREYKKLEKELIDHEPRLALDGGEDGLGFYRRITKQSKDFLREDGILAYEIGYNQAEPVKDILDFNGFKDIEIIQDLAKRDRVVIGKMRGDKKCLDK